MCLFYRYVFPREDTATSGATSSQVRVTSPHNISLMGRKYNYNYERRNWYIKLEITMIRKSGTHLHATYGVLNDFIRSHQRCIPWYPPLEIEPTTTVCRSIIYIYIYIYIYIISSLIKISLNIIDIFCLYIFLLILSYCRIGFIVFGGNWLIYFP